MFWTGKATHLYLIVPEIIEEENVKWRHVSKFHDMGLSADLKDTMMVVSDVKWLKN